MLRIRCIVIRRCVIDPKYTRDVCASRYRAEHNRIAGYHSRGSYPVHAAIKTITVTSRNNWVAAYTRTIWWISALIASRYHIGRLLLRLSINPRGRITIRTHACWAIVIFLLSSRFSRNELTYRIYEKFPQRFYNSIFIPWNYFCKLILVNMQEY